MTTKIAKGASIPVHCSVSQGAFLDEYLITIDTTEGSISGFIDSREVFKDEDGHYVNGIVQEIKDDKIVVRLPGSFFTTTGIAHFSHDMLEKAL